MNAAVIVLYNPDIDLLKKNYFSIESQVNYVIISDNSTDEKIKKEIKSIFSKCIYIDNNGNRGIAFALNRAIEYCFYNNISWLLTLDQDSISPSNLIKSYSNYINNKNLGIICCCINYNNKECDYFDGDHRFVDECITSASYVNVDICYKLGGFDEKMFIDLVDFEYCYRLKEKGYKILQTSLSCLNHRLGDLNVIPTHVKRIHVGNHSDIRKYYISRNTIYCYKKHKKCFGFGRCLYKLFSLFLKIIFFEKDKINKISKMFCGIYDGIIIDCSFSNYLK